MTNTNRRDFLRTASLGALAVGAAAAAPELSLSASALAFTPAPASPSTGVPVFSDADGIQVVSTQRFDDRDYNVVVRSAALGRAVNVRVLLPSGYAPTSGVRYPVLYLFVGTSGLASDWITMGHAAETTAARPLILVMPDIGFDGNGGGWFTDWVDTLTTLGPSQWETFHVNQLIPWVDHNLPTIAAARAEASQASPRAASARPPTPPATPTCSSPRPLFPVPQTSTTTRRWRRPPPK